MLIYVPFGSWTLLPGSHKSSENVDLLKKTNSFNKAYNPFYNLVCSLFQQLPLIKITFIPYNYVIKMKILLQALWILYIQWLGNPESIFLFHHDGKAIDPEKEMSHLAVTYIYISQSFCLVIGAKLREKIKFSAHQIFSAWN